MITNRNDESHVQRWAVYVILALVSVVNPAFLFGWIPGLLTAYALCVCAVLIKKGNLMIDTLTLLFGVATSSYVLVASLSSPFANESQAIYQFVILGVLPIVFVLVTQHTPDKEKLAGLFLIVCLAYLQVAISGVGELGHFGGLYNSASIFGGHASILALICFILFNKQRNFMYLLFFIAFLILLILSEHRAGILALIICGFYALLSMQGRRIQRLILASISLSLLVAALPYIIKVIFFDNLISFESINTSGRFTVWPYLINEWYSDWQSIIFGGGGGLSQAILIAEFDGINTGIVLPHNEFIRIGVDYGLLGLIFCFGLILRSIRHYTEFPTLLSLHFIIECSFSNVLFWQISYLLPMFIFLRKPNTYRGK